MLYVAKFGGSSLADAHGFAAVKNIILSDRQRKAVVVSAPGRRHREDTKVTDLLYLCHGLRQAGGHWQPVFREIAQRFLGICPGICDELEHLRRQVETGVSQAYLVSRGEYLSAKIMAALLGWKFIDAADWLFFTPKGTVDTARSYGTLWRLADGPFVTPGFYGLGADGEIRTFTRGGSDVTGALVAAALDADLYENWTDVPGILQADPRLIPMARPVSHMTYGELSDLSLIGTQVLHEGAVRPVRETGIGLCIRSVKEPEKPGTLILPQLPDGVERPTVLSLASRRQRALVSVTGGELDLTDAAADFTAAMLDRQTASVPSEQLESVLAANGACEAKDGLALIAVVFAKEAARGAGASELLAALKKEGITVEAILRPFGGHTLLLAVDDRAHDGAMFALWKAAEKPSH